MTLVLCGILRPTRVACYLTVFRPVTPLAWLSFSSGKNRTRPFAASRADHLDTVPYDFPSGYPCPEHRLLCRGALKKESFRFPVWIVAQHKQNRPCCVNSVCSIMQLNASDSAYWLCPVLVAGSAERAIKMESARQYPRKISIRRS